MKNAVDGLLSSIVSIVMCSSNPWIFCSLLLLSLCDEDVRELVACLPASLSACRFALSHLLLPFPGHRKGVQFSCVVSFARAGAPLGIAAGYSLSPSLSPFITYSFHLFARLLFCKTVNLNWLESTKVFVTFSIQFNSFVSFPPVSCSVKPCMGDCLLSGTLLTGRA